MSKIWHLRFWKRGKPNPVTARARYGPRSLIRSVPATLGFDASLLGASELAFEPLVADPAMWIGRRNAVPQLPMYKVARPQRTNRRETVWNLFVGGC